MVCNKVLIKLEAENDEGKIFFKSFYTNTPRKFLEMYLLMEEMEFPFTLKKEEFPFTLKNDDDDEEKEVEIYIKDFEFNFGGDSYIPCITIYGEAI